MDYLTGVALAVSLTVFGAACGIAFIGYATLTSVARQPNKASDMRLIMIVLVSLVEGLALFGIVVCLLIALGIRV